MVLVPPPPQLPPPPPIAPQTTTNQSQSPHSSELLSESLNTYTDNQSNFNQPNITRNSNSIHQNQSTPMHNNHIPTQLVFHNMHHHPIQHICGTNTIPNFIPQFQPSQQFEPNHNVPMDHHYTHQYNPPQYHHGNTTPTVSPTI
jgi:hypothetical protein